MLSLSQFRTHLFPIFRLMKSTGETFEVVHQRVVYDVSVRRTNKVPNVTHAKRERPHELISIETAECPDCHSLVFNNVCMNTKCVSVIQPV